MATVQTVLGPIEAAALGVTLSHEHVFAAMGEENRHYPWRFDWEATRDAIVRELREAKAGGVDSIIDLTTPDLGRDVRFVRELARAAGVNVVVATGIWRDVPRSFWERDLDASADVFVHEIEVGIEDTDIRAGVIKVANDAEGVTSQGERILRSAARALRRTGCPISTHQWAPAQVGMRQVEIFREEGAPLDRVCIGHSADTTDIAYLEALLKTGVYLSMDRYPGAPGRPDWEQRNATLKTLIDRGWAERLMVGHDYAPRPVFRGRAARAPEGPTRYVFLNTVALPALRATGVSEEAIDLLTREVPRRFLTGSRQ